MVWHSRNILIVLKSTYLPCKGYSPSKKTILQFPKYFPIVVLCWICSILTISLLNWLVVLLEKCREDLWTLIFWPVALAKLFKIPKMFLAPFEEALANNSQSSVKIRLEILYLKGKLRRPTLVFGIEAKAFNCLIKGFIQRIKM